MSSKLSTCLLILMTAFVTTLAQDKTCDLGLKVFSYDAMGSPKCRLMNVSVRLEGKGVEQTTVLSDKSGFGFRSLKEGKYKLEFQVAGYKRRAKSFELDCNVMDEKNTVTAHAYLWRDRKSPSRDLNLVADEKDVAASKDTNLRPTSSDEKIFGKVNLRIVIDEDGNVVSASRIDGDRRLADRAIKMARQAKFAPMLIDGRPFQVTGSLAYNFVP